MVDTTGQSGVQAGSGSPLSLGLEGACKTICVCGVVPRSALSIMHVLEVGGQTIVLAIVSCHVFVPFNVCFKSCARPIHADFQLLSLFDLIMLSPTSARVDASVAGGYVYATALFNSEVASNHRHKATKRV